MKVRIINVERCASITLCVRDRDLEIDVATVIQPADWKETEAAFIAKHPGGRHHLRSRQSQVPSADASGGP